MEGGDFPTVDVDGRTRAAYEVVIDSLAEDKPADWQVLILLEESREAIAEELTRRAVRRFGPAYFVAVTQGRTGGSVHTVALLMVRYSVRAISASVDELRRFAGEIEVVTAEALHEALEGMARGASVSFQVVAEADEDSLPAPEHPTEEKTAWDRIAPILAAIGTGIGILGFVAFVGGAIDWARFHATGLPEEQALAVVPTQDLVVIGAGTLVPAVLWGLLACVLYGLASALLGTREQRIWNPRLVLLAEEHAPTTRAIFLALMVLAFEAAVLSGALGSLDPVRALILACIGILLSLLTFSIAKRTTRFAYLSAAIFLSLSVFLGGVAYARALSTPELRGAAIVRANQRAIIGFFVAENGSRVYLARLDVEGLEENRIDRSTARLIGIDEEEVSSIDVGAPTSPEEALEHAQELADELCEQEIPKPLSGKLDAKLQNCWTKPPGIYLDES